MWIIQPSGSKTGCVMGGLEKETNQHVMECGAYEKLRRDKDLGAREIL